MDGQVGGIERESNKRDILIEGAMMGLGRNLVREIPRNPEE